MKTTLTVFAIVVIAFLAAFLCAWVGSYLRAHRYVGKSNRTRYATRMAIATALAPIAWLLSPFDRLRELTFYGRETRIMVNIGEGTHGDGQVTRYTTAAIATRFLLVEKGGDNTLIQACNAATDIPFGVCTDEASAAEVTAAGAGGAEVNVQLLGQVQGTLKVACGGTVSYGDWLVTTAAGKAQALPAAAATYYIIGRALQDGVDGDVIEFAHCVPVQRVVP